MADRKIRIALVHNIISPYRINLFERVSSSPDLDLTVFYLSESYSERKWKINKDGNYKNHILKGFSLELGNIIVDIKPSIFKDLIRHDPDVIILGGISDPSMMLAYIFAKLRGKKTIIWSEGTSSATSLLGKLVTPLTKVLVRNSDSMIVPGNVSKDYYSELGATSIFIAPNAVDYDFFSERKAITKKDELKGRLGLIKHRYLLFVGQLIPRKGVDVLISSYARLRKEGFNVGLVIVGDGPLHDRLQLRCVEEAIPDVRFTGWVSDEDKANYYSVCDVFVLPTHEDVWGLVINEAMSSSLPVITTLKAGAASDMIVDGKNGYVIDHPDEIALTNAMRMMMDKDDLSLRMAGEASRHTIEAGFTYDIMASKFANAIRCTTGGDR